MEEDWLTNVSRKCLGIIFIIITGFIMVLTISLLLSFVVEALK